MSFSTFQGPPRTTEEQKTKIKIVNTPAAETTMDGPYLMYHAFDVCMTPHIYILYLLCSEKRVFVSQCRIFHSTYIEEHQTISHVG